VLINTTLGQASFSAEAHWEEDPDLIQLFEDMRKVTETLL
jgi:hypothetical protein